jgi:hypothetical protein
MGLRALASQYGARRLATAATRAVRKAYRLENIRSILHTRLDQQLTKGWRVLVVDDFVMNPLDDIERRLFLERSATTAAWRCSTALTSQLAVSSWHMQIVDPTIRQHPGSSVHNGYRLELFGESLRKKPGGRPSARDPDPDWG